MSSTTKIKEKTLNECLRKLDEQKLIELYNNIPDELKSKKKITTKERIKYIEEYISIIYPLKSLTFTDYEMQNHQDLIEGKKISNISDKLLDNYFIFEEDDNYILPKEIKEKYQYCSKEHMQKEKYLFTISFYVEMNGILEITKLIELLKETGLKLTKKKVLECIKEKDFIVKNNIIYVDNLAENLDKEINLLELKNENHYKEYTIEEMLSTIAFIEEMNYEQQIESIFSKEIKDKEKLYFITNAIFNMIRVGCNYQEQIKKLLSEEKIKLSKNKQEKLIDLTDNIYWNIPSWIFNGYCEAELLDDKIDLDNFDFNEEFADLSKEEQIEVYITTYMTINGVMETEVLLELLEVEHHIKLTISELKQVLKKLDGIIVKGKYLQIEGLEKEHIEEIMQYKNLLGQYKVIDNMEQMIKELDEVDEEFDEVGIEYNLPENVVWAIKSIMNLGGLEPEVLKVILEAENYKMSSQKQKQLLKDLQSPLKKLRIWTLNGYQKTELNGINKKQKIGRNDSCPCGSGKKYKQCCGK